MDILLPLLTEREKEMLAYISDYIKEEKISPSVRDIVDAFDLASNYGVQRHISSLETKGYITRVKGEDRTIRVLRQAAETSAPYPLSALMAQGDRALVVSGDRHKKEHMVNGDYVIVRAARTVPAGTLVAVTTKKKGEYRLVRKRVPASGLIYAVVGIVRKFQ